MSHQSRRRDGRSIAARTAPISVIIALLATIALVIGLGSTAAIGEETSSSTFDNPAESIDPKAHAPDMGVRYVADEVDPPEDPDPFPEAPAEEAPAQEIPWSELPTDEGLLGEELQLLPGLQDPEITVDGDNPPMVMPQGRMSNMIAPLAIQDLTPTASNPPLPQRCGVNVAVVLDLSNSVKDASGVQPSKNAANAIIEAVGGSGGHVGIFTFATNAPSQGTVNQPWMPTSTPAEIQAAKNHVNGLNTPTNTQRGGTNWEGALKRVDEANRAYDIVYFITDGVPTANDSYNGGNSQLDHLADPGYRTHFSDLDWAIQASNALKAQGMYIAPVAVGLQTSNQTVYNNTGTGTNMTISGTGMIQRIDPSYILVNNYNQLEALINSILVTCASTVIVEKQIVDAEGNVITTGAPDYLAGGWDFTLSDLPMGFDFDGSTSSSATVTTGNNGKTPAGRLNTDTPTGAGPMKIAETAEEGFQLFQQNGMNATCRIGDGLNPDQATGWQNAAITNSGDTGFLVDVKAGSTTYCIVQNRELETTAAIEKSPRPGPAVQANADGEAELVYTVKVTNNSGGTTGTAAAETGTIWESVLLPASVTARGDITVGFTADSGVIQDGVVTSIPAGQFVNGAQIPLANNLTLPVDAEATFTITVPVQVTATAQQWQDLGECTAGTDGTFNGGVPNEVVMELEDFDGTSNNIACIPIVQQQVSVEKSPRPGDVVEADVNGDVDLVYTVTVTNNGGSTGQLEADSGPIFDSVQLPASVTPRSNVTVSFAGTNGASVDVPVTSIAPATFINGASIQIADNVNLPANSTGVFTITVPAKINATTPEQWQSLSQCVEGDGGTFTGGVPNGVTMDNDFDGPENNTACIPVIQRQVSVEKSPRPGEAVQANAQGEAVLVYTVKVTNTGGSTGDLAVDSGEIIEAVKLTDKVVANGDVTVAFAGNNGATATGVLNLIDQADFIPDAEIVIASNVNLPANSDGTFTITVPVKVLAETPEEWNALGECLPGVDGGFLGGVHNAVIMLDDFDGPGNNIACIPIVPQPKALVTIVKEDHEAVELPGAKFALYAAELDGSGAPIGLGTVLIPELENKPGSESRFSAAELSPGFYYLVEIQSPQGYSLLPTPIGFELVLTGEDFSLELLDAANQSHVVQIDDDLIIRVADTTSGDLPQSGSDGVAPFAMLAGLILTLGLLSARKLGVK